MNDKNFEINISSDVKLLLKKLNLLKSNQFDINRIYSEEAKCIARKCKYKELYDYIIAHFEYDILLNDDSWFQFKKKSDEYRYAFMKNPQKIKSLKDFITENGLEEEDNTIDLEDLYESSLETEYIQSTELYLRYDVSPKGYAPNVHSYSHLHFGLNEMRLPCSKILTPVMFTELVIKTAYPNEWQKAIENKTINDGYYTFKNYCKKYLKNIGI